VQSKVYTTFFRELQGLAMLPVKAVVFATYFPFHQLTQVWKAGRDIGTMRADLGA
jgi:hypothetical protein